MSKDWCEHTKDCQIIPSNWLFCPICGTSRPVDKKVDLDKLYLRDEDTLDLLALPYRLNRLIDYLKSESWKS